EPMDEPIEVPRALGARNEEPGALRYHRRDSLLLEEVREPVPRERRVPHTKSLEGVRRRRPGVRAEPPPLELGARLASARVALPTGPKPVLEVHRGEVVPRVEVFFRAPRRVRFAELRPRRRLFDRDA